MQIIHGLPQSQQPGSCLLQQPGVCLLNGSHQCDRPSITIHLKNLALVLKT